MPFFTPGRLMKFGAALLFDLVKFILALAIFFGPLAGGIILGILAVSKCQSVLPSWVPGQGLVCEATGAVVGVGTTVLGYGFEATGVGAGAIETAGEVLADAVDALAWCVFFLWFAVTGVRFSGGKRANARLLTALASSGIGLVPFLNMAPTITIGVVGVEYQHWKEEQSQAAKQTVQTRAMRIRAQQRAYQEAA
jgi:hypothetical protein